MLEKNTRSDAVLRNEAVTCAVCHVKNGYIVGPYGNTNAPHPVKRDEKLLTADTCSACHQATAMYTDTLVCTFDTADEWRASPYAAKGQSCSSCHMPSVQRPLVEGGRVSRVSTALLRRRPDPENARSAGDAQSIRIDRCRFSRRQ